MPDSPKVPRSFIVIFILMIIGVVGLRFFQAGAKPSPPGVSVRLAGETLRVMVADTPELRHKGLSGRGSLAPYQGMLFVFPRAERIGFVMRDMEFPIDIIWLRENVIVDIAPNVPVQSGAAERDLKVYYPRREADMVLELAAGWARMHGVKIGDKPDADLK